MSDLKTQGFEDSNAAVSRQQPRPAPAAPNSTLAPKSPSGDLVPVDDLDTMSGAGLDNPRQEEMKPSFLYLLQTNSKVVNRGADEYIDGAQAGCFLSTGSQTIYDGDAGVEFVPFAREMTFIEWVPIDDGGGFKGQYAPEDHFVTSRRNRSNQFKKIDTGQGTELVQTFALQALIGPPGFTLENAEMVIIPFTSIKIRHYNEWYDAARRIRYPNSKGDLVNPDIYCHRWKLTAAFESKWKPNGAWNVRIALAGGPRAADSYMRAVDPLRQEARKLFEMASAGQIKADFSAAENEGTSRGDLEDEIPF